MAATEQREKCTAMGEAPSLASLARTSLFLLLLALPLRGQLTDGKAGMVAKRRTPSGGGESGESGVGRSVGGEKSRSRRRCPIYSPTLSTSLGRPASFCPLRRRRGPRTYCPEPGGVAVLVGDDGVCCLNTSGRFPPFLFRLTR